MLLFLAILEQQMLRTVALSKKAMDSGGLRSDVKFIKCEVCSQVAKSAAATINEKEVDKKFDPIQVLDIVESLCDPKQKPGRWMRKIDLVERLRKLRLLEQDGQQDCKRECHTIAMACRDVLEDVETELAERLYALRKDGKEVQATDVENWLCAKRTGASDACRKSPPLLPKDREPGPSFEPKSEKDIKMENLMEEIRAANPGNDMGLNMMNPGDMAGMGEGNDDDDDDDDDLDEEEDKDMHDQDDSDEEGSTDDVSEHGERSDASSDDEERGSLDDTSLGFADAGPLEGVEPGNAETGNAALKVGSADSRKDEL